MDSTSGISPEKVFENEVKKEVAASEERAAAAQHSRDIQKLIMILLCICAIIIVRLLFLYISNEPKSKKLAERFIVPVITALLGILGGRFGKTSTISRS